MTFVNIVKRISFIFFIMTLLSSFSAAIFVNDNINPVSAKKSSHSSSGGDSNDTAIGDIISSKGSNGDDSGGSGGSGKTTTTTPSTDQGNTGLSTTNLAGTSNNGSPLTPQQQQPDNSNCKTVLMVNCGSFKPNNTSTSSTSTSTTNTPTFQQQQQQQPYSNNCNTKLMIGCASGGSVQCIVAPCGPSSTTSTNAGSSINGSVTGGGSVQCIVAPCGPSSTTSTSGSPLTPQQQYQQCASGIGGVIPGNCSPPPATITEQNRPLQTLNPQQTCQDGSTPAANGICQNDSTPQQACPGNVARDANGICFSPAPIITCPLHTVRVGTHCVPPFPTVLYNGSLILGEGKLGMPKLVMPTVPPIPNTNTIAPICPSYSYLAGSKCVGKNYYCPTGYTQDENICTPTNVILAKIICTSLCKRLLTKYLWW